MRFQKSVVEPSNAAHEAQVRDCGSRSHHQAANMYTGHQQALERQLSTAQYQRNTTTPPLTVFLVDARIHCKAQARYGG